MRLGFNHRLFGRADGHADGHYPRGRARRLRLGVDREAYGSDAITPLAWIGALTKKIRLGTAIMQMPGAHSRR